MESKVLSEILNHFHLSLYKLCCVALTFMFLLPLKVKAEETRIIGLDWAIEAAWDNDPWLAKNRHVQDSVNSMSVAAGTLPDPKVSFGLANLATDTFDFDQEPMTQLKVGVVQMIPRGDTLKLKRSQLELVGSRFPAERQDRKSKVTVKVSGLWLDAYKAQESIVLIERDKPLFEQLADVVEASYSAALGKIRQQDIIRAHLELTRLEDRLSRLRLKQETAVEGLVGWISNSFRREYLSGNGVGFPLRVDQRIRLAAALPSIEMMEKELYLASDPIAPELLYKHFVNHPALIALDRKIDASDVNIELAKQKFKPEWGLSASYGYRDDAPNGSDRADFLSLGVTFDVPIFTKNRQDRQLDSARSQSLAMGTEKWLLLRKMISEFEKFKAQLHRLIERERLYHESLLPQMHEQAEASLTAYMNDDGDFAEVVRSRIAELNARIDALAIQVDKQKVIVQLNYFFTKSTVEDGHSTTSVIGDNR